MRHTGPGRHRKSAVVIGTAAAASGVLGITGTLASMSLAETPLASVDITTQQPAPPGPKIAVATLTSVDVSRPQPPTTGPKTVVIPGTGSGDGTGDGPKAIVITDPPGPGQGPKAIVITDNPGDGHGPKAVVVPGGDPGNGNGNGPKTVVITGTGSGDGTGPKAVGPSE